jgi:hypothetical protein
MYVRGFVAGILSGFEKTLEALMRGVDEDARRELAELSGRIEHARRRLDPGSGKGDEGETQTDAALG